MKIKYVGPHASVQIAATGQECARGETIDVVSEVARELVKQESWKPVTVKKKQPKE